MKQVTVPRLGWSMDEGILVEWLKQPGEHVSKGEMIFVLEGDKASQEIESFDEGQLHIPDDAARPGDSVAVGQVIGFLLAAGDTPPDSVGIAKQIPAKPVPPVPASSQPQASTSNRSQVPPSAVPSPTMTDRPAGPAARRLARQLGVDLNQVTSPDPTGRIHASDVLHSSRSSSATLTSNRFRPIASPRARRRAEALSVDLTQVQGSGRNQRILERDVVAFRQQKPSNGTHEIAPIAPGHHVPASPIRMTIAQRMVAGVTQAAPVTITTKTDATELVRFRNELKAADASPPSYNSILVKLVASALREQTPLNACWHNEGIYFYDAVNLCVGVDTDAGLVAPVIEHADQRSLTEIAGISNDLIERARTGNLTHQELQGGTFTITNLGMFGIDHFTPVLNLPQAAILGIGRIAEEANLVDGQIVMVPRLSLSLTFDHRVVDGAPAARWLQQLCESIQSPANAQTD